MNVEGLCAVFPGLSEVLVHYFIYFMFIMKAVLQITSIYISNSANSFLRANLTSFTSHSLIISFDINSSDLVTYQVETKLKRALPELRNGNK